MLSHGFFQVFKSCLKTVWKLSKVVPKMSYGCLKAVPKLFQGCTKDVSKLHQSCFKDVSKLSQSCTKVVSNLSQSCTKAVVFCLVLLLEKSNRYEWGSYENYIWSSSIRRRGWKWRLDRAWWRALLWSRPFHHCSPGRSRVSETSKKYCNSPERASQNKLHKGTKGVGAWNDQFVNSWLEINFFTVTAWFALWTEVDLGQVASCHTWY